MARPEPMNATPAHSKAKISVYFPDPLFVAGEHVTGKVELECKAERGLGICDIKVELFAIQELTSRDHSATNTFMHLTRYFQGPGLPPSNAVHPHPLPGADDALPVDYYLARKGTTTFFFRFPLPASSPASIDFGKGLAKLKYEVRASVGISWRMERQRVMERKEVPVIEAPGTISDNEQIVVGENGKIWIQGRLLNPYVVAGQDACVELFVKNHSTKKTTSLNLSLTRHLHLPTVSHVHKALQISDILLNMPFRGPEYIVQPGTEGIANLVFTVPKNAQGVRPGRLDSGEEEDTRGPIESLFDVRCLLEIKIGMGIGNKDIIVELPVSIVHPVAMSLLPPPPAPNHYPTSPEPLQRVYSPPAYPLSAYQSPMLGPITDPYALSYISPPTSPPIFPPNLPLWSPTPPSVQPQMMHGQYYYYPPPPVMGYAYPVRPSSADPLVAQQLPILPTQQMTAAAAVPTHDAHSPVVDSPATPIEQGEPGKGERASRISAHLRMSSRTRSVSPQSHRFPQSPLAPNIEGSPGKAIAIQPPINTEMLSASPNTDNAPVLSPRPVLTPKQSFSLDRGTLKSEHVIDLERMAAEEIARANSTDDRNKALPPHPAASESPTPVFPPEPKLSPTTTRQRPELWGRESGLAALERKLLEQVGTRKPELERRADVRSVLPGPIAIPPTNDPRYDPLNDSAISSLALGADLSFGHPQSPPVEESATKQFHSSPPVGTTIDANKDHREVNSNGREKQRHVNNLRKAATGRVAAWLGGLGSASPPPEPEIPPAQSPDVVLGDLPSPPADIDPHPLLRSPAVPPPETPEEPKHDSIPTRSSGFVLHAAKDTSFSFEPPRVSPPPRHNTQMSSQAEVRPDYEMPGIISPSPLKPVFRRIENFSPKAQALDAKYDIRSARGGRGGKVTSVATLWASLASQQESASTSVQSPQKVGTFSPAFRGVQTKIPSDKQKTTPVKTPPHVKKHHDVAATNVADLTARRARMVKSTSDPAVVSSSLATPVLSSTASLARPIQVYPTYLYPQTTNASAAAEHAISGSSTPKPKLVSSPGPVDLGFGQARLKDLIKKYQQGFGQ